MEQERKKVEESRVKGGGGEEKLFWFVSRFKVLLLPLVDRESSHFGVKFCSSFHQDFSICGYPRWVYFSRFICRLKKFVEPFWNRTEIENNIIFRKVIHLNLTIIIELSTDKNIIIRISKEEVNNVYFLLRWTIYHKIQKWYKWRKKESEARFILLLGGSYGCFYIFLYLLFFYSSSTFLIVSQQFLLEFFRWYIWRLFATFSIFFPFCSSQSPPDFL